ncbi:F-box domain-containing protein [Apiospora aurea]|uniref:F-box domain-containing protein n=1 Tax=Apiospora aurea TaxID=335848 RepID=A0ABR1QQN3_9PEZI
MESELENFREQWRAEVARSRNTAATSSSTQKQQQQRPQKAQAASSSSSRVPPSRKHEPSANPRIASKIASHQHQEDDDDLTRGQAFDEPAGPVAPNTLAAFEKGSGELEKEPETALEFYERAVDKESAGKLGDSLHLYRRAFRLDNHVEKAYRDKHFPGRWGKQPQPQQQAPAPDTAADTNPSNAPATVPNTAHHSLDGPPLSLPDLIASFAGLSIQPAPPEVEGMPAPPSPLSALPEEILVHILRDVAILDIADFVRLSQVCKRFAFLVATEDRIWRRVSLGEEFGFGAMVYHFQRGISWEDLSRDGPTTLEDAENLLSLEELRRHQRAEAEATTLELVRSSLYASSWQNMWRRRPRIRFNGCYISTVNYIRQGHSTGNQITWNSPVHIVTYYRYLRFFRDGTVISLLTTADPADVVHNLTKELARQHENKAMAHLPTAVMSEARKGRWRLSCPALDKDPDADIDLAEVEGDLFVETESSVGPKYEYRMDLALKSAGKGARNNKLVWKGFWSYNRLTDDWGAFELKNDKAYYFSRVKSYGFGGV